MKSLLLSLLLIAAVGCAKYSRNDYKYWITEGYVHGETYYTNFYKPLDGGCIEFYSHDLYGDSSLVKLCGSFRIR